MLKSIFLLFISSVLLSCSSSMKLISYNIRYDDNTEHANNWDNRKRALANLLTQEAPHILSTQEGLKHQLDYLLMKLEHYKYFGVGRDDGNVKGEYCAIFYDSNRIQVVFDSTFWLSETPEKVSVGWDAALPRVCTYGLIKDLKTGKRAWVLNTHFDHIGTEARLQSSKLLVDHIKRINKENLPVILMGDFNLLPNQEGIQYLKTYLKDALEISQSPLIGPTGTFNGFSNGNIEKRIDYFFTRGLKIFSYKHLDKRMENSNQLSDHLAVLIHCSINY